MCPNLRGSRVPPPSSDDPRQHRGGCECERRRRETPGEVGQVRMRSPVSLPWEKRLSCFPASTCDDTQLSYLGRIRWPVLMVSWTTRSTVYFLSAACLRRSVRRRVRTVSGGRRSCLWALPGPCWSQTACSASLGCGRRSARRAPARASSPAPVRGPWGEKRGMSERTDEFRQHFHGRLVILRTVCWSSRWNFQTVSFVREQGHVQNQCARCVKQHVTMATLLLLACHIKPYHRLNWPQTNV